MNHPAVRTITALLCAIVLTFAALAGSNTASAQTITIRITHTLDPISVIVVPGTVVTFENVDGERHRMRTTTAPAEFDSGNLEPGQSFSITLDTTGTYHYLDERNDENPAYQGEIVVSPTAPTTVPGGPPTTSPPAPTALTVSIGDRIYTPAAVTVAPGGTVTWVNNDDRPHTVTADDRSFDSGIMNTGDSWSLVFPNGGTFSYFCELHPDMRGSVAVQSGGNQPPPDPPPPTAPPATTLPPTDPPPTDPPPTDPPPTTVPGTPAPSTATVTITGNQFAPATITIVAGGTVRWVNQDAVPHTVTAIDRSFDSGILRQADTWSTTFATVGTYPYFCELHPEMTATIVVVPAGTPAPPPAPAPTPTTPTPTSLPPSTSAPTVPAATPVPAPSPSAPGSTPAAPPSQVSVSIVGNSYVPQLVTIAVGGSVTWTNNDQLPHTVTAPDRSFDSDIMFNGDAWSMTFPAAGTYTYFCELHPEMTATVIVTTPGAPPPPVVTSGAASATAGGGSGSVAGGGSAAGTAGAAMTGTAGNTGTSVGGSAAASAPGTANVTMGDDRFQPVAVTIGTGGTVKWTNTDAIPHTVTADDGSFDSGIMMPGDTFSFRFTQEGTMQYSCTLHPGMVGTVEVVAGADGPADEAVALASDAAATGFVAGSDRADGSSTGGEGAGETDAAGAGEVVIRITESEFPAVVTIAAGQTVTWINDDDRPVDVAADDGSFASGELAPGDRFSHAFGTAGATSYRSNVRDRMEGMVVALSGSVDDVEVLPTVAVYDAWFAPRDLVVHQGDTVRWAFGGVLPHTVTADDGLFDSGILEPGAIFTFTFDELGTYSYSCIVHPSMIGTVTVVPADEEIPASRSGISAIDAGDDGRAPASVQFAPGRGNPSDGAGAMVLLGLGLLMGLAVGVLYGVGKIATPAAGSDRRLTELSCVGGRTVDVARRPRVHQSRRCS